MATTYIGKVTFIGDSHSGKTSIIQRYQEDQFKDDPQTTIGVDFTIKEINASATQPHNIKLQIWDTAGQERFNAVIKLYFKFSYAMVVVFDLTSKESFEHITNWIKSARQEYEPEFFVIVGNKSDLTPVITEADVHDTLETIIPKFEYTYLETSAKQDVNINKVFQLIIDHINLAVLPTPNIVSEDTNNEHNPNIKNQKSLKKVNTVIEKSVSIRSTTSLSGKSSCCGS